MVRKNSMIAYEVPEAVSGDPYVRVPAEADKLPQTIRLDRQTGEVITLWEEKMRYPFKTRVGSRLYVRTREFLYKFDLRLSEDGTYIWDGSTIPSIFWGILGISSTSPEGLRASKWHDNLLQFKQDSYNTAKYFNPKMTVKEFRKFTTDIYVILLISNGVNSIKANLMGFFINIYQFFNPDWKYVS